jgi:hypothetical protein
MLAATAQVTFPKLDIMGALAIECPLIAQDIAEEHARQLKLALISSKKVASGKTLQSVTVGGSFDSGSRSIFKRRVLASRSWIFINDGRRAGSKMPVHQVGTGPRGGKIFEPLAEMLSWFLTLGIPKAAWWPIMAKIKRDGIKPVRIAEMSVKNSRPRTTHIIAYRARRIAERLFAK